MRSVLINFPKKEAKDISETLRDTETFSIENDPLLLRKAVGSYWYWLSIHHTPAGLYSFAKSFILIPQGHKFRLSRQAAQLSFISGTSKIKILKTDSRMARR